VNSYQPQQQQTQYRPNRAALWVNDRKTAGNQPDFKGNIEISWALLQELTAAFNAGQYQQDRGNQPCIKLDFALYAQQVTPGDKKPILSGQLSTIAETQQSAAMRQQAKQQYAASQPQQPQYAPQQPVQQPQYAPAPMPVQAQPAYQQAPQQLQPAPQPVYQQAPEPMYQQPPQAPAPMPQPPAAPAPMPGAIHGQPPAAPAPTLPHGF
jgi:hypothetical protein